MRVIVKPRQAGKTHELVEWVKKGAGTTWSPYHERIIIVHDQATKLWMIDKFKLRKTQVYSWAEWRNVHLGPRSQPEVMIDNVDILLQNMFGPLSRLKGFTLTGGENVRDSSGEADQGS